MALMFQFLFPKTKHKITRKTAKMSKIAKMDIWTKWLRNRCRRSPTTSSATSHFYFRKSPAISHPTKNATSFCSARSSRCLFSEHQRTVWRRSRISQPLPVRHRASLGRQRTALTLPAARRACTQTAARHQQARILRLQTRPGRICRQQEQPRHRAAC